MSTVRIHSGPLISTDGIYSGPSISTVGIYSGPLSQRSGLNWDSPLFTEEGELLLRVPRGEGGERSCLWWRFCDTEAPESLWNWGLKIVLSWNAGEAGAYLPLWCVIFVKLGLIVLCFCLFLHLPKEYVNGGQHLRRILSRSEAIVAYVESGDVTGPESAGQVHPWYLVWSFKKIWIGSLACWSLGFQRCMESGQNSMSYVGSASKQNLKQESRKGVLYFVLSRSWWSLNRCETGTFVHTSVCFSFYFLFFVSPCLVLSVASWGSVSLAVFFFIVRMEISLFLWKILQQKLCMQVCGYTGLYLHCPLPAL